MKIKQDPITKLWCRSDGAVCMPPTGIKFKTFRWTFGYKRPDGYKIIKFNYKNYKVHRMICHAFHGLCPVERPEVDHINRCPSDNRPENLRWADRKLNNNNKDYVDESVAKYKVRYSDDRAAYNKAYRELHCDDRAAYNKAYRELHCDDRAAYNKTYYKSHRDKYAARSKRYCELHRDEYAARSRAYGARKRAEMKAQGLVKRKGPDGKYGWFPRKHPIENKEVK